ncbi:hypothetical protein BUALT_Bualt05G0011100 [Buddleja alternifolia]|uniref:Uncharacterized protein n=1 Tax=Buddleja alternifolia TaxID=168488 RepID=A0AAV6XMG4_9LAMI|nr:hypothetical protein BUALT_Bualt05G0011100 [Buddleja alternifolia]
MDPYRNGSINGTLDDYENQIQNKLAAPMPWIGFYIVAASFICSMAMGFDLMVSLVSKRYWFPCITCSLNATYLTLLAVSSKLAVDLSSSMLGVDDKLAKVSSLVFMSTAMCNSMPSLASMDRNEMFSNIIALAILVVTIVVNVCIYDAETSGFVHGRVVLAEETVATVFMLLLLVILCCSSVVVPTTKKYIESKYREMNQTAQVEGNGIPKCRFTVDELRLMIQRYRVMAETGNPQFVMARSVISATSGLLCLLMVFTLLEAHLRLIFFNSRFGRIRSDYGWSTPFILYTQSAGVFLGSIAPLFRWFLAAQFRISEMSLKSSRGELKIERYWTLRLVELRERPLRLGFRRFKIMRKLIYHAKRLLFNICIGVQILVVLTSKLILFMSSIGGNAIFFCFRYINILQRPDPQVMRLDLSRYVLLLEGEAELPNKILTDLCYWSDHQIKFGRRRQSKTLAKLLNMSENFDGVMTFDNNKEVESLHSQEPPNCWSWPVVTLASIAIALPNITRRKFSELLSAVSEGMYFVNLIEIYLDGRDGELDSIAKAAHGVWERVELHHKWQDKNIQETSQNGQTYRHVLQELSHISKNTVEDFKTRIEDDVLMENPQNWPVKVVAANSMYRITQTILLVYKDDDQETDDEEMFRRLSVMISDIFAACLTNLVHFIRLHCHSNVIKERLERVWFAAIVLGRSEEILEILQQRELPDFCLDPAKSANIEQWRRALTELNNENPVSAASNNEMSVPQPNGEYVSIDLDG